MRFGVRWGIGIVLWFFLATPAHAAFPGANGMLVVQPLHGRGLILVRPDGAGRSRICASGSVCGYVRRPRFSPDGRAIVFGSPAIHLIATDGSCMNCQFGVSANPAFRPGGTLVTFVSHGTVVEDGIDGLRQAPLDVGVRNISDAVWSASGRLAVVARARVWIGRLGHLRSIGTGDAPSWSPDGSRLAIVRRGWITVVRASNGAARRLIRGTSPTFSPDGRLIAFIGAQHKLETIRSLGGRARWVGRVRGVSVDWQPLPAHLAACVAPPGSKVIASSAEGSVTTDASAVPGGGGLPDTAALGCLFADGRERLLEHSTFNSVDDATDYPMAAIGGTYASVVTDNYDEHYGGEREQVEVFDLRTGDRAGFGGESETCPDRGYPGSNCTGIDRVEVGSDGVSAVHVDGGPLDPSHADSLQVLCASKTLCLAQNQFGTLLSSTSPTQGPWSPTTGASMDSGGAGGGSCPSVSLCVLVAGPSIYTSTSPSGGSWRTTQLPGSPDLLAVDCPTMSLCVATTLNGQVAVSTDPTGGASAWSLEDVDANNPMYGVSCPSESECVATDLAGNIITTTNPTGGPSAWSDRKINSGMTRISCPSTSLCVAQVLNSGVTASTNPVSGQWTSAKMTHIFDLACPSTSLCVEVAGGSIGVSTNPASGDWTSYSPMAGAGSLGSISCPTASFCVAAGLDNGNVLVSSNPAGGPSAWTSVLADKVDCSIATGACGTEQIIASDRTGVHALATSTEFEAQTGPQLTGLALNGDILSWEDHGSPRSTQLTP